MLQGVYILMPLLPLQNMLPSHAGRRPCRFQPRQVTSIISGEGALRWWQGKKKKCMGGGRAPSVPSPGPVPANLLWIFLKWLRVFSKGPEGMLSLLSHKVQAALKENNGGGRARRTQMTASEEENGSQKWGLRDGTSDEGRGRDSAELRTAL